MTLLVSEWAVNEGVNLHFHVNRGLYQGVGLLRPLRKSQFNATCLPAKRPKNVASPTDMPEA